MPGRTTHSKCVRWAPQHLGEPKGWMNSSGRGTYVSQVEGDLQVPPEVLAELGVHVQHLLDVLAQDLVQVAVGQGAHVRVGLAGPRVQVDGLAEDVVLPWREREGAESFEFPGEPCPGSHRQLETPQSED